MDMCIYSLEGRNIDKIKIRQTIIVYINYNIIDNLKLILAYNGYYHFERVDARTTYNIQNMSMSQRG